MGAYVCYGNPLTTFVMLDCLSLLYFMIYIKAADVNDNHFVMLSPDLMDSDAVF